MRGAGSATQRGQVGRGAELGVACVAGEARRAAASWAGEGALTRESGPVRAEERRSGLPVGKGREWAGLG